MGVSYHFYVGPYLFCKNEKVSKEVESKTCPNKDCHNYCKRYLSGNHCTDCGSKIEKIKFFELQQKVNWADASVAVKECLHEATSCGGELIEGYAIWLPNMYIQEGNLFSTYSRNVGVQDMTDVNQTDQINWFKTKFSEAIEIMRKMYGEVEIRWGVVQSAS